MDLIEIEMKGINYVEGILFKCIEDLRRFTKAAQNHERPR